MMYVEFNLVRRMTNIEEFIHMESALVDGDYVQPLSHLDYIPNVAVSSIGGCLPHEFVWIPGAPVTSKPMLFACLDGKVIYNARIVQVGDNDEDDEEAEEYIEDEYGSNWYRRCTKYGWEVYRPYGPCIIDESLGIRRESGDWFIYISE